MNKAETCYDCGEPDVCLVIDDEDMGSGYRGTRAFCAKCAMDRGLITAAELVGDEASHD
jgi:hypothetical protein